MQRITLALAAIAFLILSPLLASEEEVTPTEEESTELIQVLESAREVPGADEKAEAKSLAVEAGNATLNLKPGSVLVERLNDTEESKK